MKIRIFWIMTAAMCFALMPCLYAEAQPDKIDGTDKPDEADSTRLTKNSCSCDEIISRLDRQNQSLSRELRQIRREIMSLKTALTKPGLQEIIGGIGYILGLFGIGFYIHARKQRRE